MAFLGDTRSCEFCKVACKYIINISWGKFGVAIIFSIHWKFIRYLYQVLNILDRDFKYADHCEISEILHLAVWFEIDHSTSEHCYPLVSSYSWIVFVSWWLWERSTYKTLYIAHKTKRLNFISLGNTHVWHCSLRVWSESRGCLECLRLVIWGCPSKYSSVSSTHSRDSWYSYYMLWGMT